MAARMQIDRPGRIAGERRYARLCGTSTRRPGTGRVGVVARLFALLVVVATWSGAGGVADAAAQTGEASRFVRQLGGEAIATLQSSGLTLEEREARFHTILRDGFDLPFIGRFVLGRYWKKIDAEQRSDYQNLFSEYVLQIYSARLGGYAGETLTVVSERPAGSKDVGVLTRIDRPSGPPIMADWRVRITDSRPRIIDVAVEGVSMVVTQRAEFAAVIQRNGFDGLIEVLRARTTKLPISAAKTTTR